MNILILGSVGRDYSFSYKITIFQLDIHVNTAHNFKINDKWVAQIK